MFSFVLQVDRVRGLPLLFSGVRPQAPASLRPEVRIAESVHWQSKGDDRVFVILSIIEYKIPQESWKSLHITVMCDRTVQSGI